MYVCHQTVPHLSIHQIIQYTFNMCDLESRNHEALTILEVEGGKKKGGKSQDDDGIVLIARSSK